MKITILDDYQSVFASLLAIDRLRQRAEAPEGFGVTALTIGLMIAIMRRVPPRFCKTPMWFRFI